MKKKEVSKELREKIVVAYNKRETSVENMIKDSKLSSRVFYRVLEEEGVEIKRKPRRYSKPPKHNLIGNRYHHLLVEDMKITEKSKDNSYRCICKCDCGRIADVNTNYLMRNLRKTCGHKDCEYHRQDYTNHGNKNVMFAGYEGIHGSKWSAYRLRAKRKGFDFDISIEYAWGLYEKQNKLCALTGEEIFFGKTITSETTASLDRIDSSKGYIMGNVHWVHKDVNKMKMDLSMDRFKELCTKIVENFTINLE